MSRPAPRRIVLRALVAAAGLLLAGCLSPTLPLPPPENPSVSKVDADGNVTLTGGPGSAQAGALVYAYNRRLGKGDIDLATQDGAFELTLPASVGDEISVWQEVGQETSTSAIVKVRE